MPWPTDITAMDKGRLLEVVFDDGRAIRAHSDDGRPVVASMPESPQANALLEIARRVADTLVVGAPGAKPAPRIRVL